jgi:hypothetical protein
MAAASNPVGSMACGLAEATCIATIRPKAFSSSSSPADSSATITPIRPNPSLTALWT